MYVYLINSLINNNDYEITENLPLLSVFISPAPPDQAVFVLIVS